VIFSVWGSDFYRAKSINLWLKKRILKDADIITFANEQTRDDFVKVIPTNAVFKICRFGLLPLDYLENLNSTKQQSRYFLNLPENKIIITIGYNLNPNQQHLKIIKEIKKLRNKDYYNDLFLLVPLTYPADKHNYTPELVKKLESAGLQFHTIGNYLSEIENAHLRNCSDIMIQLQTSDQLSGAMQEYLCTENLVITGSWLPYKILLEKGVNMILINSISELSIILDKTISNFESLKKSAYKNIEIIMELSSWKKNTQAWIDLYL
jgi:glycosyltransferase involved in cell wall biosynthesis